VQRLNPLVYVAVEAGSNTLPDGSTSDHRYESEFRRAEMAQQVLPPLLNFGNANHAERTVGVAQSNLKHSHVFTSVSETNHQRARLPAKSPGNRFRLCSWTVVVNTGRLHQVHAGLLRKRNQI